jgi:3-isopropylmalate/(R)-2-methylmalate dehydratase large subunit
MEDVRVSDLMDDINTDAMTPAWACFDYRPEDIARNAYAGITVNKERLFPEGALMAGGFEVIVSGYRKGVGSSRETAVQAEKWSGIRIAIAASFAPIHARNNISQGVLMGDHAILKRLQDGESVPLAEFTRGYDVITQKIIEHGGLFPFTKAYARGEVSLPAPATARRPMNIAEKVLAAHVVGAQGPVYLAPGDAVCVRVDGGYSHEFTTAQVAHFLAQEYGEDYALADPRKFAVFEDHLIYADGVAKMAPFSPKIQVLRDLQREFQRHTGVQDFSAHDGVSPGICHSVARERIIEPGDFIQATDSHTCMGGANDALAYGVGATEYAALVHAGFTFVEVPEAIRFELVGRLAKGVTAKDVMLHILATHAKQQATLDRVMEFGGPGLASLSPDERATLANMATECSAKAGVVEADDETLRWITARRPGTSLDALRAKVVRPDPGAQYAGGVHTIDLTQIRPMVATPGEQAKGIPSDPTNGAVIADLGEVRIDIAYGGSCTAGKEADLDMYAQVMKEALTPGAPSARASSSTSSSARRRSRPTRADAATWTSSRRRACASSTPAAAPASDAVRVCRRPRSRSRCPPSTATTRTGRGPGASTWPRLSPWPRPRWRGRSSNTGKGCSPDLLQPVREPDVEPRARGHEHAAGSARSVDEDDLRARAGDRLHEDDPGPVPVRRAAVGAASAHQGRRSRVRDVGADGHERPLAEPAVAGRDQLPVQQELRVGREDGVGFRSHDVRRVREGLAPRRGLRQGAQAERSGEPDLAAGSGVDALEGERGPAQVESRPPFPLDRGRGEVLVGLAVARDLEEVVVRGGGGRAVIEDLLARRPVRARDVRVAGHELALDGPAQVHDPQRLAVRRRDLAVAVAVEQTAHGLTRAVRAGDRFEVIAASVRGIAEREARDARAGVLHGEEVEAPARLRRVRVGAEDDLGRRGRRHHLVRVLERVRILGAAGGKGESQDGGHRARPCPGGRAEHAHRAGEHR